MLRFFAGVMYILLVVGAISAVARSPIGFLIKTIGLLLWNTVKLCCKFGITGFELLNKIVLDTSSKLEKGQAIPKQDKKVVNMNAYAKRYSKK